MGKILRIDLNATTTAGDNTWIVTPDAGQGGSLAPAVPQTVNEGDTVAFLVTPDASHLVVSVDGCGGGLVGNTYTTAAVTVDCTVTATFVPDDITTYVVTPEAGVGGALVPSVPQTVSATASIERVRFSGSSRCAARLQHPLSRSRSRR